MAAKKNGIQGAWVLALSMCGPPPLVNEPVRTAPIVDAGAPSSTDAGASPAARKMSVAEAVAFARTLDPNAFSGFTVPPIFDSSAFGDTFFVRASDVREKGSACLTVPVKKEGAALTGFVSTQRKVGKDIVSEGHGLKLDALAVFTNTFRSVEHPNGTNEGGAGTSGNEVLGALSELGPDRLIYQGCALAIREITCVGPSEIVHDACPDHPRVCGACSKLEVKYVANDHCGHGSMPHQTSRSVVHDCAPCEPDRMRDALPDLEAALVGRALVLPGNGPAFFTNKKDCESQKPKEM